MTQMRASAVRIHLFCGLCGQQTTVLQEADEPSGEDLGVWHCGRRAQLRGVTTLYELSDEEAGDGEDED